MVGMSISDEKRADILLAAVGERYESIRAIRARVESVGIWAIGLSLAAGGWLLQDSGHLSCAQKAVLLVAVLVALLLVRCSYLADLQRGFKAQQKAAVRIEDTFGLFTAGTFNDSKEPIFSEAWKRAGESDGEGKFFRSTFLLLYAATVFLCVSIVFTGVLTST
jgi:hypothetical protein